MKFVVGIPFAIEAALQGKAIAMLNLESLNRMTGPEFVAALGAVFENSPWVAERVCGSRPFSSVSALHEAMLQVVRAASAHEQLALLRAHPELAGKEAREGTLTEASRVEQAGTGLTRLSSEEVARLEQLNAAYRQRFGFPFIIAVRNHTKQSVLEEFERRLRNDADGELRAALAEVFKIVGFRLEAMIKHDTGMSARATEATAASGRLTTHVLDTANGLPAAGVRVDLFAIEDTGAARHLATAHTNQDGRTGQPMLAGEALKGGRYELVFHVGAFFAAKGAALASPPFLDQVPVRFAIADTDGHCHVPLLVTPYSYATYRGS